MVHSERQNSGLLWKVLTRLERYHAFPLNLDLFTGLGITAHPSFTINVSKGPKSHQGYPAVPFFETFLDAIESGIKCPIVPKFSWIGAFFGPLSPTE